jgi:thiosulfate/3-mercaptopyruvate sulfurtransferase
LLIDTKWLNTNSNHPDLHIIDVRTYAEYNKGHIPKALSLDMQDLLTQLTEENALNPEYFEQLMQHLGIDQTDLVVIYDQGDNLYAAYLFFLLEYFGHKDRVKLLNGGYSEYLSDNGEISKITEKLPSGNFQAEPNDLILATADEILNALYHPSLVLVDTRRPAEYLGKEKRALRAGHIPGAINTEWINNLKSATPSTFKTYPELIKVYPWFNRSSDQKIIVYCHSGLRASNTYFVLRLLGAPSVSLYLGSWSEWGNKEEFPYSL